jgi:hypothetical protein
MPKHAAAYTSPTGITELLDSGQSMKRCPETATTGDILGGAAHSKPVRVFVRCQDKQRPLGSLQLLASDCFSCSGIGGNPPHH